MATPAKQAAIAELTDKFRGSGAAVLTEYRGLTVAQLKELRTNLRANGSYSVVKNTLTQIAAKDAGITAFDGALTGPSGIAFITGDPVEAAKVLRDFAKAHPQLVIKAGYLEGKPLSLDEITKLADLESREVLLAKLAGGVAVIRVGGMTEVEVKERKDRVDDALNATRAAVQEGIVVGGGVALLQGAKALEGVEGENSDQDAGIAIVRRALEAPLRQIVENAGLDGAVVAGKIRESDEKSFGFNAQTDEYGDMFKFGVIDPAKVVRHALQDAASVAGLLVTTEAMIADKPEPKGAAGGGMPDMGGMGGMGGMM